MTCAEILDQAITKLHHRGHIAYRTLKRPFHRADDAREDLKVEIMRAQGLTVDEESEVLVKILLSKTVLEGEGKQVTVLFADLKGPVALLDNRDPKEGLRQRLDLVLERMMTAVHRYEGSVNQVTGDGSMALLGASIAHEGQVVRTCYAAGHPWAQPAVPRGNAG